MGTTARLALAASATFAFASLGAVVPAQAAIEHCPTGDKVELSGDDSTVDTDLPEGSQVCIKAGTEIAYLTVGPDGVITNDVILNQKGNARGISYYVGTGCTDPYGCTPDPY